jgi:HSP20 family protein
MMKITHCHPRHARFADSSDSLENSMSSMLNDMMGFNQGASPSSWAPNVDIAENEDSYQIHAELPGVAEDEVTVTLNNNVLTLSGEKKQEVKEENEKFVRVERTYGKFERRFSLPSNIMADKVDANYKEGVLTITVPKAEEAKSRSIKITR